MTLSKSNALIYQICTQPQFEFDQANLKRWTDEAHVEHWHNLSSLSQSIYQKLVFENFKDVIEYVFKATKKCVGLQQFEVWMQKFIAIQGVNSPYYYQIPVEFWEWVKSHYKLNQNEVVSQVADFELTRWRLYQFPNQPHLDVVNLNLPLDAVRLCLIDEMAIKKYSIAVHRYETDSESEESNHNQECFLLLYRHPKTDVVEVVELNAVSYEFVNYAMKFSSQSVADLILGFTNSKGDSSLSHEDIIAFIQLVLQLQIASIVEHLKP